MAPAATKAIRPATISLGLYRSARSNRPRSGSATALAAPRRRLGVSSSPVLFLGTFPHTLLHLDCRLDCRLLRTRPDRRRQHGDIARGQRSLLLLEDERHGNGDRRALVHLALHLELTGMQGNETLHDRKPQTGAFVAALIGLAGLEERGADQLQIFRPDPDAGVGHTQHKPGTFHLRPDRHPAAALGEVDAVLDE